MDYLLANLENVIEEEVKSNLLDILVDHNGVFYYTISKERKKELSAQHPTMKFYGRTFIDLAKQNGVSEDVIREYRQCIVKKEM